MATYTPKPVRAGPVPKPGMRSREEIEAARAIAGVTTPPTIGGGAGAAEFVSILRQYGLDELIPYAATWARTLATPDEMWLQLMDPTSEPGKVVDRIYPELRLRRQAGLTSSIAEIRSYREQGSQLLKAAGLDRVLNVEQFLRDRYVGNVSLNQLNERIKGVEDEVTRVAADPVVAQELEAYQRFYGVQLTSKDLVAFALDFDKADSEIRRSKRAVELDVQAGRAGFGDLSRSEAERLADIGVSDQGAAEGFGFLSDAGELLNPLVGSQEDVIGRGEGFDAIFAGNANARRRIAQRARSRTAEFGSGGGFATGQDGFGGIGSAR